MQHLLRDVGPPKTTGNRFVIAGNSLFSRELESLWPPMQSKSFSAEEQVTIRLAPVVKTKEASMLLQGFVRAVNARSTCMPRSPPSTLSRFEDGFALPAQHRLASPPNITSIITAGTIYAHTHTQYEEQSPCWTGARQLRKTLQRRRIDSASDDDDEEEYDDFMSAVSFNVHSLVPEQHSVTVDVPEHLETNDAVSIDCFGRARRQC